MRYINLLQASDVWNLAYSLRFLHAVLACVYCFLTWRWFAEHDRAKYRPDEKRPRDQRRHLVTSPTRHRKYFELQLIRAIGRTLSSRPSRTVSHSLSHCSSLLYTTIDGRCRAPQPVCCVLQIDDCRSDRHMAYVQSAVLIVYINNNFAYISPICREAPRMVLREIWRK